MIDLDLEAIKKQLTEISPWPWTQSFNMMEGQEGLVWDHDNELKPFENEKDKVFIAQAPQTISKLVAEVESLRFELEDRFGTEDILVETRHKLVAANAEIERLRKELEGK